MVLLDTHTARVRARERSSESPVPAAEGRPTVLGADYSEHRGFGGNGNGNFILFTGVLVSECAHLSELTLNP